MPWVPKGPSTQEVEAGEEWNVCGDLPVAPDQGNGISCYPVWRLEDQTPK